MQSKETGGTGNAVETVTEDVITDRRVCSHPTDTGWAWMVLLGAFLENILLVGARRGYSILYKEFMSSYNASATEVALTMTIQTVVISIASLLILSIGTRCCSTRVYVMLGGVFGGLAYFINSFATGVPLLLLSQGIFFGLAHSCCHGPTLVTIGTYFSKRKGLATLLAGVGGSIGALSFPQLVQFLMDTYGLQGVLLILSGLVLHFSVSGALFRPTSFYERQGNRNVRKYIVKIKDDDHKTDKELTPFIPPENRSNMDGRLSRSCDKIQSSPKQRIRTYSDSSKVVTKSKKIHTTSSVSLHKIVDTLSDTKGSVTFGSAIDIVGSFCSIPGSTTATFGNELEKKTNKDRDNFCFGTLLPAVKSTIRIIFNKDVLGNRLFQMFITVVCFAIVGVAQIAAFLPAHAEDIGISRKDIAILLTIMGCVDLLSKLSLAFISDLNFIKRHHIVAVSCLLSGIVVNFIHYFHSFDTMLILVVTYGMFGQTYVGLFPVILADFVGVSNMSSAMGFVVLTHGTMLSITSPLIGLIRDSTGSFDLAFHIMGICFIVAGVVLFLEPIFRKLEEERINSKDIIKQ